MKNKKSKSYAIPNRTWILFGIFLIISIYCLKIVFAAQKMAASVVIPAPITVQTPTPIHKTIKK
jgi:uncharacterized membrane protein